ncbi:MAG: hypothetical protein OD815_001511 [Candidatus Alkanophagales archaeon MCA70_species_2]|nr:hypothetical protein [Candidatus Alkanophaga liquidiphilum]
MSCPRCGKDDTVVALGLRDLEVGRTRKERVSVKKCGLAAIYAHGIWVPDSSPLDGVVYSSSALSTRTLLFSHERLDWRNSHNVTGFSTLTN